MDRESENMLNWVHEGLIQAIGCLGGLEYQHKDLDKVRELVQEAHDIVERILKENYMCWLDTTMSAVRKDMELPF